jgi:hypothetical protein
MATVRGIEDLGIFRIIGQPNPDPVLSFVATNRNSNAEPKSPIEPEFQKNSAHFCLGKLYAMKHLFTSFPHFAPAL